MAPPLPLTVCGPITPLSPSVRVTGVVGGAAVRVLMNGEEIGSVPDAPEWGDLWVPLSVRPIPGRTVTAVQQKDHVESLPSFVAVTVVDVPDPLPTPVILSELNSCMTDVLVDGLVPGAKVLSFIDGVPFGSTTPAASPNYAGLDPAKPIGGRAVLQIRQEATVAGRLRTSQTVSSLGIAPFPANPIELGPNLPAPMLGEPLFSCDVTYRVSGVPGAVTELLNISQSISFLNPAAMFITPPNGPGLETGTVSAQQTLPRCKRFSGKNVYAVSPLDRMPKPIINYDICPSVPRLSLSNLLPRGILTLVREVHSGNQITTTEIGEWGICAFEQSFDFPADLALDVHDGTSSLRVYQRRCSATPTPSDPIRVANFRDGPIPSLVDDVYDCVRSVRVAGAFPGALVQVFEEGTDTPMSDEVQATRPHFVLRLWFPTHAPLRIFIKQRGCNADGRSSPVPVRALPEPMLGPDIIGPVRPHAPTVQVRGVLPGAMVDFFVAGELRTSVEIFEEIGTIIVPLPLLEDRQFIFASQRLCGKMSFPGHGADVHAGQLTLSLRPSRAARGLPESFLIDAADLETGSAVDGQVSLNGQLVGATGQRFVYTPKPGDAALNGVVKADGYQDASFSIELNFPPWEIVLALSPAYYNLDNARIDVDKVTWNVTPEWNLSLSQKLEVPKSNPAVLSAHCTVPGPFNSDPNKTVEVQITVEWSTKGGDFNGNTVPPQSDVAIIESGPVKIVFDGKPHKVGYYFSAKYWNEPTSGGYFIGSVTLVSVV